jgi:polyisoprenoid-binding protein YceI
MKKTIILAAIALTTVAAFAQKKTTTTATVSFDATTSLDALPIADNKSVIAAIDSKTGTINFEAQVKSFTFGNPMMQEHFNSPKWLDSEKYPTTVFKGKITDLKAVNFSKDGTYPVKVAGTLTLHGITKEISSDATIEVKGKEINATAAFTFKLADYKVSNAGGKIADEPKITVAASFK